MKTITLQTILEAIRGLESSQKGLEKGQADLQKGQKDLQNSQKSLENRIINKIESEVETLARMTNKRFDDMELRQDEFETHMEDMQGDIRGMGISIDFLSTQLNGSIQHEAQNRRIILQRINVLEKGAKAGKQK